MDHSFTLTPKTAVKLFSSEKREVIVTNESLRTLYRSENSAFDIDLDPDFLKTIPPDRVVIVSSHPFSYRVNGSTVFEEVPSANRKIESVGLKLVGKQGNQEYVSLDAIPLSTISNDNGAIFVFQCNTQQHQLKQECDELRNTVDELQHREEELEKYANRLDKSIDTMRHDIKGPLQAAEAHLSQLTSANTGTHIQTIRETHEHILSILDDSKDLYIDRQTVENEAYYQIERLAMTAWKKIDSGNSTIRVEDKIQIKCNKERVLRVFENLFRNAVIHNTTPVTVKVGSYTSIGTTTRNGTKSGFYVSDDGIGIKNERRDEVFEFGETDSEDGTGIGLAVTRRVAEAHEWDIVLQESSQGGAKFTFTDVDVR